MLEIMDTKIVSNQKDVFSVNITEACEGRIRPPGLSHLSLEKMILGNILCKERKLLFRKKNTKMIGFSFNKRQPAGNMTSTSYKSM